MNNIISVNIPNWGEGYNYTGLVKELRITEKSIDFLEKGKDWIEDSNQNKFVNIRGFIRLCLETSHSDFDLLKNIWCEVLDKTNIKYNDNWSLKMPKTKEEWNDYIKKCHLLNSEDDNNIKDIVANIVYEHTKIGNDLHNG